MRILDTTEIKLERIDLATMRQHPWVPYEVVPNHFGVAQIIRDIAVKVGKFTVDDQSDEVPLRVLIGMGFEAMFAQLYPDMQWQPGVLTLDGIQGHPDGYSLVKLPGSDEEFFCIDEFKYTALSLREKGGKPDQWKDIRERWVWQHQVMSYLKMHPAQPRHARFHILWAMGAYEKHTLDERYLHYLIEYDEDEIERNWRMVQDHKVSLAQ